MRMMAEGYWYGALAQAPHQLPNRFCEQGEAARGAIQGTALEFLHSSGQAWDCSTHTLNPPTLELSSERY